jgi:hypothetical protein
MFYTTNTWRRLRGGVVLESEIARAIVDEPYLKLDTIQGRLSDGATYA